MRLDETRRNSTRLDSTPAGARASRRSATSRPLPSNPIRSNGPPRSEWEALRTPSAHEKCATNELSACAQKWATCESVAHQRRAANPQLQPTGVRCAALPERQPARLDTTRLEHQPARRAQHRTSPHSTTARRRWLAARLRRHNATQHEGAAQRTSQRSRQSSCKQKCSLRRDRESHVSTRVR